MGGTVDVVTGGSVVVVVSGIVLVVVVDDVGGSVVVVGGITVVVVVDDGGLSSKHSNTTLIPAERTPSSPSCPSKVTVSPSVNVPAALVIPPAVASTSRAMT